MPGGTTVAFKLNLENIFYNYHLDTILLAT